MIDLVVTLIGRDRPGLVEAVAQTIVDNGGNWLESRMIQLAGKFAGILRVEVPADRTQALTRALEALVATGLKVVAEPGEETATRDSADRPAAAGERIMDLELLGLDRPGLIKEISQLLAEHGVNVEELASDCSAAPMSGEMIFRAEARIKVPGGLDAARLRAAIEHLASDLAVEIRVEESAGKPAAPAAKR